MLTELSPTEVAFLMAGLTQAVPAVLWLIGAWILGDTQRAAAHWAGFAALSAVSFVLLVAAMQVDAPDAAEPLRAAGNVCGVLAMLALQRGIWLFIGMRPKRAGPLLALATVLVASWFGLAPASGPARVGVNSAVQAVIAAAIALDLYRYARGVGDIRWPALLPLPVLVAALAFAARGARALFDPASVQAQMTVDSGLNVGSAFAYVVLALSFHATLMALVIMRLVGDLRRLSRHDGLTGALNRRALEEALLAQAQRSRRSGEPFCVLMLDADHFKAINDRFGHAVGDLALKQLAALLRGHMREVDRFGRFGGEEFLILLPGLTLEGALPVAERLREVVAAAPLRHGDALIALSVSIGIAEWGGEHEETSRLVVRADAALYQAKRHGRDRVASARADPRPA